MGLRKRFVAVCLAAAMAVAGAPAEGLALQAEAAPNTQENAYMGFMLTKEEFQKISYTDAEAEWSEYVPGENENGLANYEARYVAEGTTLDEVLGELKDREKFFWQKDEENYREVSGDDGKTDEGYYALFANAQGLTAQNVTNLDDVNGVLFDTHYYNDLEEEEEPDENTQWHPYTYEDLTVEAKAALTFYGCFSNITVKYGTYSKNNDGKEYPVVMRGEAAGSLRGVAEAGAESSLYLKNSRVYGISGFDKTLFLPVAWQDEESGEEGVGRWMELVSPTGEEEISFESICAAEVNEGGEPQEIEGEEGTSGIELNIWYHDNYLPTIAGSAHLGVYHETNEETGEEETRDHNIGLNYFEERNEEGFGASHRFTSGDKVVNYGNAQGWTSFVWYNAPESDGEYVEYRIDAQGCLYRESDRMFRVNRYGSKAEYDAYRENGQWADGDVGESATLSAALQALAYDSELNPNNAYYTLALVQDWDNKAEMERVWETDLGSLSVPEKVKGLRLTAEGWDTENGFKRITGILDEITVGMGTELELTGWYRAKEEDINISGGKTVSFADAKINGNVSAANGKVISRRETAVKSLMGMKSLELSGNLTVEEELRFAENGQMDVTEECRNARILARSEASIEIPKLNCVYDTQNQYGNALEIFEEVKSGKRPQITFSGERSMGDYWQTHHLIYQLDADEADEDGNKPEYSMACRGYRYVPEDEDGNENWDEAEFDLILLNNKVYRIEWDYESEEGTNQIQLDDGNCTFLYQKLVETEHSVADVQKDIGWNELIMIPYEASAVAEAATEDYDIGLSKDPYTDDSYGLDVWDEWNCEYHAEDSIVEYYVSGITDLAGIVVAYGQQRGDGNDSHYEGRSLGLYPVQKYLNEKDEGDMTFTAEDEFTKEQGRKKYAMFHYDSLVKSGHYILDTAQELTSLADAEKIQITAPEAATYKGSAILGKPVVKRLADSYVLVENTDYTLEYQNNTNAGEASVTIKAKEGSEYTGEKTVKFTISPKPASGLTVSEVSAQTYTGNEIKPAITVSDGSSVLTTDDYSVSYSQNTNAGTAKITITGKRNYAGTQIKNFTIAPKSISGLAVSGVSSQYSYTGKAITPAVAVSDGNKRLTSNDCSVSYSQNINIGTAKITITGKGNYTGTLARDFTITVQKNASYEVGGYQYKIMNAAVNGKGTVSVTGLQNKTAKKIKVADAVTIGGVKFSVASIGKNAFKGCKKATEAVIGKNVTTIGDNAFSGCTSLKKATVGKAVKTIGKSVFEKDGKLKSIKVKSTVLKKVGKNALKGIHKKAVISVPKKQLKSYKKLFKRKGQASSVKIK